MAEVFAVETTIERPVEQVWAQLTDWPGAARWMPGVESVRVDGNVLTVHSRGRDRTSRITAYEPGRSVALTSERGGVRATYVYTCEATGAGTRVSLRADCVFSGPWKLAGAMIRGAIRRADSGQLQSFKRVVETVPSDT
ncbi:SRPBCC family protein [Phytohabitans sp. ZYX-F-186]|uniref:SRPBCC family protein n=1 Tax=Phytohabitans maris TaxID=3071409 RepID=A0ABU0ZQC8_9ACTN|nr:SRPBCC family protein [Phytohabitans sp. ZYX-F-186]MDQ7908107.1 SRPBCC family protein [Phytohabitans sp. ZYX-F-186]